MRALSLARSRALSLLTNSKREGGAASVTAYGREVSSASPPRWGRLKEARARSLTRPQQTWSAAIAIAAVLASGRRGRPLQSLRRGGTGPACRLRCGGLREATTMAGQGRAAPPPKEARGEGEEPLRPRRYCCRQRPAAGAGARMRGQCPPRGRRGCGGWGIGTSSRRRQAAPSDAPVLHAATAAAGLRRPGVARQLAGRPRWRCDLGQRRQGLRPPVGDRRAGFCFQRQHPPHSLDPQEPVEWQQRQPARRLPESAVSQQPLQLKAL